MTPDERVGAALGVAAVLIVFAVSVVGIGGPFPDGHYASTSVIGTAAYNSFRWHTLLPVEVYLDHPPNASLYYMHHPLGMFWVIDALTTVFGLHDWVLRLPPLVYVTATTALLWRIGRALWGALPGGLGALAYAALPITLGFANYHDLEQPVIFGVVLASWGYLRFVRTWRDGYAIASLAGFVFALNNDWAAYLWGAPFLAGLFVYGFLLDEPRRAPLEMKRFGRYWALMCLGVAFSVAVELAVLGASNRIADVLQSYLQRSAGANTPLAAVLAARRYRIELMFTAPAIALGKLALPVIVARAVVKRSHLELLPLPIFFCALVQYLVFKEGADVHIFWPHYFAPYFALAVGALASTVGELWVWGAAQVGPGLDRVRRAKAAAPWVALVALGLPLAFTLKDGLSLLRLARETGGRFAEVNLDTDLDKEAVLRWFLARYPATVGVGYHGGIHDGWALQWELRPRLSAGNQAITGGVTPGTRVYILDTRATSSGELREAASRYHVHAVGYLWVFDRTERPAPLDGYVLEEREPGFLERLWLGPTEPVRAVRSNAWATWEWRAMLGQPAVVPTSPPSTTDELRIAHNVAVERGDAAGAARLREALAARFNLPLAAQFEAGTSLIGAVRRGGARRSITLYFLAGAMPGDAKFSVHAKVTAPPRLSGLPAAPEDLEIAGPPTWPTSFWRRGHIYSLEVVYRQRPGTEVLRGSWIPGPRRTDGPAWLDLARL
ncbi:MAG TPA: glycosyltransferase family 39 protein [Polyangia bacterium]|nr:glycosyltransferase family 39 protein [Polyangia bacterium]